MTKKFKALIIVLALVVIGEGYFIYVLSDPTNNIIPLNNYSFFDFEDRYISAQGTWMSDTDLANSTQSSEIICIKDSMLCIEARGEVSDDGYLIVSSDLYDIDTWSDNEVTTKPQDSLAACTKYIMRLDRLQKQVTASRTTINNEGMCSYLSKEPFHLYLGDGIESYFKNK